MPSKPNLPDSWLNLFSSLSRSQVNSSPLACGGFTSISSPAPAQVALNWLIHFSGDTLVAIPGASKACQAQESAAAMNFKLTADELARLDQLTR